jgi:tRNA dimethylallyltransferase
MRNKIILIGGPTASGKSQLAMDVAKAVEGAVVNADSMQVYRELRILTARPSPADEAQVPHYLYGVLSATEACSAAHWAAMCHDAIRDIWRQNLIPVVVGGTGLYFKALLQGLAPVPQIPAETRHAVRLLLKEHGPEYLYEKLKASDPEMAARLNPGDSHRLSRALEVYDATGRSLLTWQAEKPQGGIEENLSPGDILKFTLQPPRDLLYERCNQRLRHMIEDPSALEELSHLLSLGLSRDLPLMKALGVPHLAAYLEGRESLETALGEAQAATRQYAKRQLTWFRHQCHDWHILDAQYSESNFDKIFSFIKDFLLTTKD